MYRTSEDVKSNQAMPHHRGVQRLGITPVEFVEEGDALVGGGEEGAGAAGEIADLHCGERVGIAPIRAAGGFVGG